MEINWTVVTYLVVIYFAIAGFLKGWWKEAMVTVVLAILVFFLQNPAWASTFVSGLNELLATLWGWLPAGWQTSLADILGLAFGLETGAAAPQIDPTTPGTWLMLLALLVGVAVLVGRASLQSTTPPTLLGKLLGGLVGGLNGFLIAGLVREYLDGRALPGQTAAASQARLVGSSSFGPAASGVSIQAVDMPSYTILDSIIPWLATGLGLFLLIVIVRGRLFLDSREEGRKISTRVPPFYKG